MSSVKMQQLKLQHFLICLGLICFSNLEKHDEYDEDLDIFLERKEHAKRFDENNTKPLSK